jgi:hypothetical protein
VNRPESQFAPSPSDAPPPEVPLDNPPPVEEYDRPVVTDDELTAAGVVPPPEIATRIEAAFHDLEARFGAAIHPRMASSIVLAVLTKFIAETVHRYNANEDIVIDGIDERLAMLRGTAAPDARAKAHVISLKDRPELAEKIRDAVRRAQGNSFMTPFYGPHDHDCICDQDPHAAVNHDAGTEWFAVELYRGDMRPRNDEEGRAAFIQGVIVRSADRTFAGAVRRVRELGLYPDGARNGGIGLRTKADPSGTSWFEVALADVPTWQAAHREWQNMARELGEQVAEPPPVEQEPTDPEPAAPADEAVPRPASEPGDETVFEGETATTPGGDVGGES